MGHDASRIDNLFEDIGSLRVGHRALRTIGRDCRGETPEVAGLCRQRSPGCVTANARLCHCDRSAGSTRRAFTTVPVGTARVFIERNSHT